MNKKVYMMIVCLMIVCSVQAHVLVESGLQQRVTIEVGPATGQSALCAKKFSLDPFGRAQLSGGDGSYDCQAVTIKINSQGPQLVDFTGIDQRSHDVIIEINPSGSAAVARVVGRAK